MIVGFLLLVCLGAWVLRRRARASKLAGLDQGAPIHSVTVGPASRRLSPLKGERL